MSQKTTVVNVGRGQPYDVYIGRPMPGYPAEGWGNPFRIGRDGTRAEVLAQYQTYLHSQPDLLLRVRDLRGKRLGCWCAPAACHGDVLARLADAPVPVLVPPADAAVGCGPRGAHVYETPPHIGQTCRCGETTWTEDDARRWVSW